MIESLKVYIRARTKRFIEPTTLWNQIYNFPTGKMKVNFEITISPNDKSSKCYKDQGCRTGRRLTQAQIGHATADAAGVFVVFASSKVAIAAVVFGKLHQVVLGFIRKNLKILVLPQKLNIWIWLNSWIKSTKKVVLEKCHQIFKNVTYFIRIRILFFRNTGSGSNLQENHGDRDPYPNAKMNPDST